jgi:hypothetical protein
MGCVHLQLKDVVVLTTFEMKKLGKIIERLGRLVELYAKCPFKAKT